jgi:hypothetical protein
MDLGAVIIFDYLFLLHEESALVCCTMYHGGSKYDKWTWTGRHVSKNAAAYESAALDRAQQLAQYTSLLISSYAACSPFSFFPLLIPFSL